MSAPSPPGGLRRLRFRQWPIVVVLLGVGLGLAVVASDHFRRGTALLAASLTLATVLRLVLPAHEVGLLASRRRWLDVACLGLLSVGLIVLTLGGPLAVPPPN